MTRFDKRLLGGLDAAAEKTGIPAFATGRLRRRRQRWLPIIALLIGFGAYIAVIASPASSGIALPIAVVAQVCGIWVQMAGPLRISGGPEKADEFDRASAMKSFLTALASIAFFAVTALLLIAGLTLLLGWTREMLLTGVIATAMMIPLMWATIPSLHASWTMAPLDEED